MQIKEALPIGTILDSGKRRYRIQSVLGQGGFGITYLSSSTIQVDNIPMEMLFAIKEHYISSMNERQGASVSVSNENNTEEVKESIESFIVEAKRLNHLSLNHPGIVRVNENFRANGTAYYVMEYIKGQSLRDYVRHSPLGRIAEDEALKLFQPIAETIGYLHENKLTHLDIKPDNILIRENGEPVVIDFGLSKHYDKKGTPTSTIKAAGCSAGYSPMEQYVGITTFTPEADIYALAATLLYMLTGKDPIVATEIKPESIVNSLTGKASPSTISAITHAMAKLKEIRSNRTDLLLSELGIGKNVVLDNHTHEKEQHLENVTKKIATNKNQEKKKIESFLYISGLFFIGLAVILTKDIFLWIGVTLILVDIPINFYFAYKRKAKDELITGIVAFLVIGGFLYYKNSNIDKMDELEHGISNKGDLKGNPIIEELIANMVYVEGGSFVMGGEFKERDGSLNIYAMPKHNVTLSSYYIGKYEVTEDEWNIIMGDSIPQSDKTKYPIHKTSWSSCMEFIEKLNSITGLKFRMPTEAEWEYAARGGRKSRGYLYAGSNNPYEVAWFDANQYSEGAKGYDYIHPIGVKAPNELGIYDMSGNVAEWCSDWYGAYSLDEQTNPQGPASGEKRISRGGYSTYIAENCIVFCRKANSPNSVARSIGLRLVCDNIE